MYHLFWPDCEIKKFDSGAGNMGGLITGIVVQQVNGNAMSRLFRFTRTVRQDPAIDAWMHEQVGELGGHRAAMV
jgi:hypothetical protein